MVKHDAAALDESHKELIAAAEKQMADDRVTSDAELKRQQQERIDARTQEILYAHGWTLNEEQAREQARQEVLGRSAYEDDVKEGPETTDARIISGGRRVTV